MNQIILYLMLGYPGAGKTTTAKVIAELTGAIHIWEDHYRKELFPNLTIVPAHQTATSSFAEEENLKLHTYLNNLTAELLQKGQSVVYDTSFNRYEDRQRMYTIARSARAVTRLMWVQTGKEIARKRATKDAAIQSTRPLAQILGDMDHATFDRLAGKLEPPRADEPYVTVDGTKVTPHYVQTLLNT